MATNRDLKAEIARYYGTQADYAIAIKVDESLVSRVIRGRRTLPPEEQERWARALGKRASELFKSPGT